MSSERYAQLAHQHWASVDPNRVGRLENPGEFFRDLGSQVQAIVNTVERQTEERLAHLPAEERRAQVEFAKRAAEEEAMYDLVWVKPTLPDDLEGLQRLWEGVYNMAGMLWFQIDEYWAKKRDEAWEAMKDDAALRWERSHQQLAEKWDWYEAEPFTWSAAWDVISPYLPNEALWLRGETLAEEWEVIGPIRDLTKEIHRNAGGLDVSWDHLKWELLTPKQEREYLAQLREWATPPEDWTERQLNPYLEVLREEFEAAFSL